MRRVPREVLGQEIRRSIKRIGVIAGSSADGFKIDLHHALEDGAQLQRVRIKKSDDRVCRFEVTALFEGDPQGALHRIVAALERDASFYPDEARVATTIKGDSIDLLFLTEDADMGVASVCLRAERIEQPN